MFKLNNIILPSTLEEAREQQNVPLWYLGKEFRELNKNRSNNIEQLKVVWNYIKEYVEHPEDLINDMFMFDLALKHLKGDLGGSTMG